MSDILFELLNELLDRAEILNRISKDTSLPKAYRVALEDEVKYAASNGAFVQIDSNSGVATESTLSSIKSILESWSSSGMPVGQSKEQTQQEQIVNKM